MKDFYQRQNNAQVSINTKENCVFNKSVAIGIIVCIVLIVFTVLLVK